MRRHEPGDEDWRLVAPLPPKQDRGGRGNDHRTTLSGMLWILRTGAPWRDLPERFGRRQSVYNRFNRWRRDGTFDRVAKALRIRVDRQGTIYWDLWCIDGTSVRAARSAVGASKRSVRTSRKTARWAVREADVDESCTWFLTVREFPSPPASPRGRRTSRRSSSRSDQAMRDGDLGLDRRAFRRRSAMEGCVGCLQECRRAGARFDKLAGSFMAFLRLASIQRYLRLLDPSDRT